MQYDADSPRTVIIHEPTLYDMMNVTTEFRSKTTDRPRHPAVPLAVCFAAGIGADRLWEVSWNVWLLGTVALACGWLVFFAFKKNRPAAIFLLGCVFSLGGGRHHWCWSIVQSDDISRYTTDEERLPVQISGRLVESPTIQRKQNRRSQPSWARIDRTVCVLECNQIETEQGIKNVSGRVRLTVTGHLLHAGTGDIVNVSGWLSSPREPLNPGDFDFASYLRGQGVRALIHTDDPDAIIVSKRSRWSWKGEIARLRESCELTITQNLTGKAIPLGSAILLGDRSRLDRDMQTTFVESGMMHILAISGLHVGILAAFVWLICQVFNLSTKATTFTVLPVVICYMLMTDIRPSVIRATVMIVLMASSRPWNRRAGVWNSLALAMLILLAWKPVDLFNTGAQLSLLSVMAIVTSEKWWSSLRSRRRESVAARLQERSWLSRKIGWIVSGASRAGLMMLTIWIFVAPLIAARMHVVSPIGMAINIVLLPFIGTIFFFGFLLLLVGLVVPAIAFIPGVIFDEGLHALFAIAEWGSLQSLGHQYVAGPGETWLLGYYILLGVTLFLAPRVRLQCLSWCAVCGWAILGLTGVFSPKPPEGLRCTFLSTGHGLAVLIETPNGHTLLYDAGSLANGDRATQVVQNALWDRGIERLDAIVISHADIDHFNGVPGLLENVPVGNVFLAQSFLDYRQEMVVDLSRTIEREQVPTGILFAGDRVLLDPDVSIRVLHPGHQPLGNDNANSLVLEIVYAGKRILLTGDLEKDGMAQLLARPSRKIDVLLSPHHGSLAANTGKLAQWSRPRYVVASGGWRIPVAELQKRFGKQTQIFSTHQHGAITVSISSDGIISLQQGARRSGD
jgi:competence protein ComEC